MDGKMREFSVTFSQEVLNGHGANIAMSGFALMAHNEAVSDISPCISQAGGRDQTSDPTITSPSCYHKINFHPSQACEK